MYKIIVIVLVIILLFSAVLLFSLFAFDMFCLDSDHFMNNFINFQFIYIDKKEKIYIYI